MNEKLIKIIEDYRHYLTGELGFSKETTVGYVSKLKIMLARLKIENVDEVTDIVINKRLLDDFWIERQEQRPYKPQTRIAYLSTLKKFLRYLYVRGIIAEDITDRIKLPKRDILFLEGLNKDEQKRLRQYLAENLKTEVGLRNTALIYFLWSTGCRISEALRLNCHPDSYIYTGNSKVISGNFHVEDRKTYVHISGKGHKNRIIRVAPESVMYLNLYLDNRAIRNEILFQNIANNRNKTVKRLTRQGSVQIMKNLFIAAEINKTPGLCTHLFRHTAINHWIEQGHTDQEISEMAGLLSNSIIIYRNRNKYLTDVFGDKSKTLPKLQDKRLLDIEDKIRRRYYDL